MTRLSLFVVFGLVTSVFAQNCGPAYGGQICAAGTCCSQYGWCDTGAAHCNPANCQRAYSGAGSSCADSGSTPTPSGGGPFASSIPSIDVCGAGSNNIKCPGAGSGGFYYRCCSRRGHCGPKNGEQAQSDYCGAGCQAGYGFCDQRPVPPPPPPPHGTAGPAGHCGPIVNKKCGGGLCCSGSNFCGTGPDFCGAANWCQVDWGTCYR
ncbi:hypothetical protein L873DRAFT_1813353 [Choiromyces venosus 120613-1]|uniref:Chitin-binding type-1 domain-containing protein n=1 Tax=Choiromyces venosus 120613-1 TaxID=1336337 RepID=A0A3N4JDW8_9PEZI|nr:hypothetical protein L873DRAFT_1813353 [Choiromyces venosus 120613-1]